MVAWIDPLGPQGAPAPLGPRRPRPRPSHREAPLGPRGPRPRPIHRGALTYSSGGSHRAPRQVLRRRSSAASGDVARARPSGKKCAWLCGLGPSDKEADGTPVRWAYPNHAGSVCWRCDRVWKTVVGARVGSDRLKHQQLMAKDKAAFDDFHEARAEFSKRLASGHKYCKVDKEGCHTGWGGVGWSGWEIAWALLTPSQPAHSSRHRSCPGPRIRLAAS